MKSPLFNEFLDIVDVPVKTHLLNLNDKQTLERYRELRTEIEKKLTTPTVYAIFHCDQWQSYESMRLIGIASEDNLDAVLKKIQKKCRYKDEDMATFIYVHATTMDDTDDMNI